MAQTELEAMCEPPRSDLKGAFERARPYYEKWSPGNRKYFNHIAREYLPSLEALSKHQLMTDIQSGKLIILEPLVVILILARSYEAFKACDIWENLSDPLREVARAVGEGTSLDAQHLSPETILELSTKSTQWHVDQLMGEMKDVRMYVDEQRNKIEPISVKFDSLRRYMMAGDSKWTDAERQSLTQSSVKLNEALRGFSDTMMEFSYNIETESQLIHESMEGMSRSATVGRYPGQTAIMAAAQSLQQAHDATAKFLPGNATVDGVFRGAIHCTQTLAYGNGESEAGAEAIARSSADHHLFADELAKARDSCHDLTQQFFADQVDESASTMVERRKMGYMLAHEINRLVLFLHCTLKGMRGQEELQSILTGQKGILEILDLMLRRIEDCFHVLYEAR